MPPRTRAGKRRALANLRQYRGKYVRSAAFATPEAVAAIREELEAGLLQDRGLADATELPSMDRVRLAMLASGLSKTRMMDAAGAVSRWLSAAPNARPSSRVPGFVVTYQRLLDAMRALADALDLPDRARLPGAAPRPVEITVRYVNRDLWRPSPASLPAVPEEEAAE